MCSRSNRYHVTGNVNSNGQAFFIYGWKMLDEFFFFEMPAIQPYVLGTCSFHLTVDGPGYNIPWREIFPGIIFFHECFPIFVSKDRSITTHGLGDQKGLSA